MNTARLPGSTASLESTLSSSERFIILTASFLGWMFAGVEMALLPLVADDATVSFLAAADSTVAADALKPIVARWFIAYLVAFLFGGATGGLVFGWFADRAGRVRAMGLSILCFSGFTGLSYFATGPEMLLVLRFLACLGIGGMWPAAVSLVNEAWPRVSRPFLAGLIGASANLGIFLFGLIASRMQVSPESWRWVMLVGAMPAVLGVLVLLLVKESPSWLLARQQRASRSQTTVAEVFGPRYRRRTLVGIVLGAVPLLGAWGSQKWMLPWAGQVGMAIGDLSLKADTQVIWGIGATLGSLIGGPVASYCGRRVTYLGISLGSTCLAVGLFRYIEPARQWDFFGCVFALGLVSTMFFGWLPLCLPELFPTSVRATGSGVTFNFGRVISALVILGTLGLVDTFGGDYARLGATTSWIYLLGAVAIWFLPQSARDQSEEEARPESE
ncbi:MAG: MFS transporter [Planctomycetales bacterium]|nr:MFS transporter [Planctomycetales bacterium]